MGSIPLPALSIHPPQQTDPTEGIQRILMMRNLLNQGQLQQQEVQGSQLENQQKQIQLDQSRALMDTAKGIDWTKSDAFDNFIQNAQASGKVNPQTLSAMALQRAQYKDQLAKTDQSELSAEQARANQLLGHLDAIKSETDPQKRAAAAQLQGSQIMSGGLVKDPQTQAMVAKMAQGQYVPSDDDLKTFESGLLDHKTQVEDALKQKQGQEATARAEEATATTAKTKAEMAYYQAHGGAPGVPAEQMSMADWLAKPENKGKGPSDYEEHMKKLVPAFNFSLMNATGQGQPAADIAKKFGMSPVAFDQAAEKYWTSGQLPPSGRGGPALAMNKAIQNRAAELHPEGSLAANSAEYEANKDSLKKIQTQFDSVTAFENTALKNINMALEKAKAVPDLGTRFANAPIRAVSEKMLGTPEMAAFRAALTTAQTESAKVLNSANATGVLSDSARGELQQLLSGNLSYKAMQSAFQTLQQDMSNRHDSYAQQIQDIQGRLGGKTAAPTQAAPQHAPGKQAGLPEGATGTGSDNKKYVVKGGVWVLQP